MASHYKRGDTGVTSSSGSGSRPSSGRSHRSDSHTVIKEAGTDFKDSFKHPSGDNAEEGVTRVARGGVRLDLYP